MQTPNLRDFYQKALIPIGLNDQIALMESGSAKNSLTTHWLIALEGVQIPQPKEYFQWKVSIYPSNSEGAFKWNKPLYSSVTMEYMDNAIELARSFEAYGKNDQLFSSKLQEKIS